MKKTQHGIAHLSLLLLVVIAAVVGFAGYKVMQSNHNKDLSSGTTPAVANTVQTIQSKADLNTAEASLNSQNLDSDLNPGQFDQDVNSLL